MEPNRVVSREDWIKARKALLRQEKALTRARDRLAAARRDLPWVRIEKPYVFDAPDGPRTLAELFDGRSQLIIGHFMFGPDWEQGCVGCSFGADHADVAYMHFRHHDVAYAAVARAPIAKLEAYRRRMGWRFPFVSSFESDFNYDFNVSFREEDLASGKARYNYGTAPSDMVEQPGTSVFFKDGAGAIYHTYSAYARGDEEVLSAFMLLDLTPKGRNEQSPLDWVRRHDEYVG